MTIIFATNNQHKVKEIQAAVPAQFKIVTLKEAGIEIEIEEPHATLTENAAQKARVIHQLLNENCFSEDTGLEVDALNGEPGVRSARYAGDKAGSDENIEKLLQKLKSIEDRKARFKTIICSIFNKKEYYFEGVCEGEITKKRAGECGFGYDAIFKPKGADKTFGEMSMEEKNRYSHRRKATDKLVAFLKQQ